VTTSVVYSAEEATQVATTNTGEILWRGIPGEHGIVPLQGGAKGYVAIVRL